MKFFATLSALFLIVAAATEAAHHHHARHHHARHLQARAGEDKCEWKCLDAGGKEVEFKANQNYEFTIVLEGGGELKIYYSYESKTIVFINTQAKFAFILVGGSKLIVVINLEKKVALVVDTQGGLALLVENINSADLEIAVIANLAIRLIADAKGKLNIFNLNVFNMQTLVSGFSSSTINLILVFQGKLSLQSKVNVNFGAFLNLSASRRNVFQLFTSSNTQIFSFLAAFFGTNSNFSGVMVSFVATVVIQNTLSQGALIVSGLIGVVGAVGAALTGAIVSVTLTATGFVFLSAANTVVFAVNAAGLVVNAAGAVLGAVAALGGAVNAALGGILSISSSVSASSSLSISGGASISGGFSG